MNGCGLDNGLLEEIDNYTELTYLKRGEIVNLYRRFCKMANTTDVNTQHRFDRKKIMESFPELNCNPFIDRTFQIFSSMKDGKMSFEDILDLASAFSEDCPVEVKAKWAFLIFDFDDDKILSRDDIVEIVARLTGSNRETFTEDLMEEDKRKVADIILTDVTMCNTDGINCPEFVNIVKRIPEFTHAFRIKFS